MNLESRIPNFESSVALVTGGAGFIGSHISEALLAAGATVRVLDNLSTGSMKNLPKGVEFLEGDVTNPQDCHRACQGVDYVFHHAARVSVADSVLHPIPTHEVNALGTLKLLTAAKEAGCKRVVYAGSASAYGDTAVLPTHEQVPPDPLSPYAVAKHTGELYCQLFTKLYGLEAVVLRYFNVFGPRQDPKSPYSGVIAQFAFRLAKNENLTIYGDGEQTRDLVPVQNIVAANLAAAQSPNAAGQVINIGCGQTITVNRLAQLMLDWCGATSQIAHTDPRQGDIRHSVADITKAKQLLGYDLVVTPEAALQQTLAWYQRSE